jgi:hypothetical protein
MVDTWIESSFDLHRCKSIHDGVAGSFTTTVAPAVRAADTDGDGGKEFDRARFVGRSCAS